MGLFKDNEITKYIDLARAKSEALINIYIFVKEIQNRVILKTITKDKLKATRTVKNNNNRSNLQKNNFARAAHFFF